MTQNSLSIGQALDMGFERAMAGDHKGAMALYRGVLLHDPTNFEAILRLGVSLFETGDSHEALYWFWRGRKISRRHPLALTNYGLCLSKLGHHEEGLENLSRAAQIAEKNKETIAPAVMSLIYNNLGNTLELIGQYKDALVALDRGISYRQNDAFPHYNRGIVLRRLNRPQEALAAFDRCIELHGVINPATVAHVNNFDAIYNRGIVHLTFGNLKQGFADYEYRLITSEAEVPNFGLPIDKKWRGEGINGKTVLVYCEQGFGDTIQFVRFLPRLVSMGAKVQIIPQTQLRGVIQVPGVEELPPGQKLDYDYWVALMSLPMMFGIESERDIPPPWWPSPDGVRLTQWARQIDSISPNRGRTRVGICWAGSFRHRNDSHRSIALKEFAKLFSAPHCDFISLQQMRAEDTETFATLKKTHANLSAILFDDFRDTAAAICQLDLVITVDTSVAHLAASLGVPTWILVPAFSTDWRWGLERTNSPWYPTARLFRQSKVGDWRSAIEDVRRHLDWTAVKSAAA